MSASRAVEPVPAPRGWLRLALFGAFVYLVSKLMEFFPGSASSATGVPVAGLDAWTPAAAGAGLLLFLLGFAAALWRANRAAGHTNAGVAGLVAAALGVAVLAVLEFVDVLGALGLQTVLFSAIASAEPLADLLGTFLAFTGLAALGVGLAHARGLFGPAAVPGRAAPEAAEFPVAELRAY